MRVAFFGLCIAFVIGLCGFTFWLSSLPPGGTFAAERPPLSETLADIEALAPKATGRPLIAVIGLNDATETTDYLMPTGILRRADIADVVLLATDDGPVKLYPALTVEADATLADFDGEHPEGADYVIVPAMSRDDDPRVMAWLQQQRAKGAVIIGVCAGAKVVAAAGLLDGKRATTHWYYRDDMLERHPAIDYVPDRRMVVDGEVVTTTGISASIPMTLTLIQAMAGREKAQTMADELGIRHWDARHSSRSFTFSQPFARTVLGNTLSFWRRDETVIQMQDGMDEVTLALVADAWSRTYLSRAITVSAGSIVTANGVHIVPDLPSAEGGDVLSLFLEHKSVEALDRTLAAISDRYGPETARVVAMQLEYPGQETLP